MFQGSPSGTDSKESACNKGRPGFSSWIRNIPLRREWKHTLVFLHGEFQGQRSLMGYSPWSCKELDMTEQVILVHMFQCYSLKSSHPHLLPVSPKYVLYICLLWCPACKLISTICMNNIYMH